MIFQAIRTSIAKKPRLFCDFLGPGRALTNCWFAVLNSYFWDSYFFKEAIFFCRVGLPLFGKESSGIPVFKILVRALSGGPHPLSQPPSGSTHGVVFNVTVNCAIVVTKLRLLLYISTLCLLVWLLSTADIFYQQFGPRSGTAKCQAWSGYKLDCLSL